MWHQSDPKQQGKKVPERMRDKKDVTQIIRYSRGFLVFFGNRSKTKSCFYASSHFDKYSRPLLMLITVSPRIASLQASMRSHIFEPWHSVNTMTGFFEDESNLFWVLTKHNGEAARPLASQCVSASWCDGVPCPGCTRATLSLQNTLGDHWRTPPLNG